jgi:hypothetical protein
MDARAPTQNFARAAITRQVKNLVVDGGRSWTRWVWLALAIVGCDVERAGLGSERGTDVDFAIDDDAGAEEAASSSADASSGAHERRDAAAAVPQDARGPAEGAPDDAAAQDASLACEPAAGRHALRIDADVTWSNSALGFAAVGASGMGTMSLFALVDGSFGSATLRACGAELPVLGPMPGGSIRGSFADALWDAIGTRWTGAFTRACDAPGCALTSDYLEPQLGIALAPRAAWPGALTPIDPALQRDDDGDGVRGVPFTLEQTQGAGLGAGAWRAAGVQTLMLALRVGARLSGVLDDCARAHGELEELTLESRVLSCVTASGAPCRPDQRTSVDGALPSWHATRASWRLVRIDDVAGCADVRAALP